MDRSIRAVKWTLTLSYRVSCRISAAEFSSMPHALQKLQSHAKWNGNMSLNCTMPREVVNCRNCHSFASSAVRSLASGSAQLGCLGSAWLQVSLFTPLMSWKREPVPSTTSSRLIRFAEAQMVPSCSYYRDRGFSSPEPTWSRFVEFRTASA